MDVRRIMLMSEPKTKVIDSSAAVTMAARMANVDGSPAPHWSMEEIRGVMKEHGIEHSVPEFFLVMNMLYADYQNVLATFGADRLDVYVEMSKAWLEDEDAKDHKLERYFDSVVR